MDCTNGFKGRSGKRSGEAITAIQGRNKGDMDPVVATELVRSDCILDISES